MALLPLDTTTGAWRAVREYAEARVTELTEVCISVESTDRQRAEAAFRIAELRELLAAPAYCKQLTQAKAAHIPTEVY